METVCLINFCKDNKPVEKVYFELSDFDNSFDISKRYSEVDIDLFAFFDKNRGQDFLDNPQVLAKEFVEWYTKLSSSRLKMLQTETKPRHIWFVHCDSKSIMKIDYQKAED